MNARPTAGLAARFAAITLALAPWLSCPAQSVLFEDTFDRVDSRNIDATLAGITDHTGSALAADAVYSQPWLDPNNAAPTYGAQDGAAANGGGAQVLSNQLQLAVGAGTSNAFVNHNFTNPEILAARGFTVSLDVAGYAGTGFGQGGGFAVGMSQTGAAATGDAFNGASRMTGALEQTIGNPVPAQVVSDFWVVLRGNNTLVWGGRTGNVIGVTGLPAKTGTIRAEFHCADFNAGSTVDYQVFLDDVPRGSGSFTWTGTGENHIGIDARDGTAVSLDNFRIATPPPGATLAATPATVSSLGASEPVTLAWNSFGSIPADATYRILDSALAVIDSGPVGAGSGSFPTTVDATFGDATFTIEIMDASAAVIASATATVTAAYPALTSSTQTAARLDLTAPPEAVTLSLAGANFPSDATYEVSADNPAAVTYASPTSGALASPLDLDLTIDPTRGSVTFTVLLKDGTGYVFETLTYSVAAAAPAPARVTNLFSDTYDRYEAAPADPLNPVENWNLDHSVAGMSGTAAPPAPPAAPDDFYLEVYEADPNNPNPASLQVNALDALQAATGFGMSCWALNHNFTDAAIAADGALSVSIDVLTINTEATDAPDRYAGFGIGLSPAEIASFVDENTSTGRGPRGAVNADPATCRGLADFHVSVSLQDNLQVFAGGVLVGVFPVDGNGLFEAPGVNLRADFAFADPATFAAGSHVHYRVFLDDLQVTSGFFRLTNDGLNHVGFSARGTGFTELDNLQIATVAAADMPWPGNPPDAPAILELLNPLVDATGAVTIFDLALAGQPGVIYVLESSANLAAFTSLPGNPSNSRYGTTDDSGALLAPAITPPAGLQSSGFYRATPVHWPPP